jgi:CrcB protein
VLSKLLLIAMAGAAGTLARYGLTGAVQRWAGEGFPWGTAAVNVLGCFLFGAVWALAGSRLPFGAETRAVLLVGFMGAFTTFSTLMAETGTLLTETGWPHALGNVLLQNTAGIGCFFLGLFVGRNM